MSLLVYVMLAFVCLVGIVDAARGIMILKGRRIVTRTNVRRWIDTAVFWVPCVWVAAGGVVLHDARLFGFGCALLLVVLWVTLRGTAGSPVVIAYNVTADQARTLVGELLHEEGIDYQARGRTLVVPSRGGEVRFRRMPVSRACGIYCTVEDASRLSLEIARRLRQGGGGSVPRELRLRGLLFALPGLLAIGACGTALVASLLFRSAIR